MISIHIRHCRKWHTRQYVDGRKVKSQSCIIDVDEFITNLKNTPSWEVKVGYNLLREVM